MDRFWYDHEPYIDYDGDRISPEGTLIPVEKDLKRRMLFQLN
jgi:hypothetical protein